MKKIVICGGHLTPALALIEELENKDVEIIFYGRKFATEGARNFSAEYKIINEKKIKFTTITTGRLQRSFTKHTIPSLLKVPIGTSQSILHLIKERPNIVVSFGSYLSLPIVFSTWLLGIRSITHEQSSAAGLANKINSHFVEKVFISFESSKKFFPNSKTILIGNLIRKSVFKKNTTNTKIKKFVSDKKTIFVTGGNQGSHVLNKLIFSNIRQFKGFNVLHQIGTANYNEDHITASKITEKNYMALDYIKSEDIGYVLNNSHLIISRSGANTLTDIAVCQKPSILIPLPTSAGGEQLQNAMLLKEAGSAIILEEKELNAKNINDAILQIENNYNKFALKAQKFAKIVKLDAAEKLASFIISDKE